MYRNLSNKIGASIVNASFAVVLSAPFLPVFGFSLSWKWLLVAIFFCMRPSATVFLGGGILVCCL